MSMAVAASQSPPSSCPDRGADSDAAIAALAIRCLGQELDTWPKPGLVSHIDTGSHDDMDAATFRRSAAALRPYFAALAERGRHNDAMETLRAIGLEAEAAMLAATGGVNTHRGAIFGLGLLCAAAGMRASGRMPRWPLGALVAHRWGAEIERGPTDPDSHGQMARRRHGVGGARRQAVEGFDAVYRIGLPALELGRHMAPGHREAARVQACFALIARLDDTNLLHRGGAAGLHFAQDACRGFLRQGGVGRPDWRARAAAIHRAFVARRLSPGGSADLLAMTLFVDAIEPSARERRR